MENLVGTKPGEYESVEHGTVADIYKAYQRKLNHYVAIKVLLPVFAEEPAFRERFTREARAIAMPLFEMPRLIGSATNESRRPGEEWKCHHKIRSSHPTLYMPRASRMSAET
jgi:serine/threonine protein kinase